MSIEWRRASGLEYWNWSIVDDWSSIGSFVGAGPVGVLVTALLIGAGRVSISLSIETGGAGRVFILYLVLGAGRGT